MLSDRDIADRMWGKAWTAEQKIVIKPKPAIRSLQPASVDLTLDPVIQVDSFDGNIWRALEWSPVDLLAYGSQGYPLMPGQVILASTAETIHVPADLAARVEGKSTLGRLFIETHQTAGFVDPGFRGKITLEILNNSPVVQSLTAAMPICQISFTRLSSPALRPYGSEGLGSHYQDQSGATPAAR